MSYFQPFGIYHSRGELSWLIRQPQKFSYNPFLGIAEVFESQKEVHKDVIDTKDCQTLTAKVFQ